ncbi:MAG: hypothetical protein R3F43_00835 [bacterium]
MSGAQYEFTGDQNRIIGNLAGKMSVVGLFLILIGLGVAIMAVVGFLPCWARCRPSPRRWRPRSATPS